MSRLSRPGFTGERADGSADDPLVAAVDEYLAMFESGNQVDVETFVNRFPRLGEELRHCLEAFDLVAQVAPGVADGPDQAAMVKNIGDFRIIREIGRGGMGVVYEAEQLSLGRSVALKVLPYAAMLDSKAITRFKNEARAAATLDHPHIVPVYAVGNERGIYYYAMSLIDGLTLAELVSHLQRSITDDASSADRLSIDDFLGHRGDASDSAAASQVDAAIESGRRTSSSDNEPTDHADETYRSVEAAISTYRYRFDQPFFRSVAALGAQAAEALDHAHEHGIVHRDIKSGNLMIDTSTKLWVTDFGLARIESDPGMTLTGDLVGTLCYMAPEQALAQRVVVDHRADIYSLGASLYELLALRPPFDGSNREALLKQIAFQEPKPLRNINRAVPVDLQTIVHKALSKDADDRYATAQEMADDLRAFVDDEPIKARPLSIAQRTTRWATKRKGVVAAVAGALILAVIGLLISNAMIAQQRNVAREAERNERTARHEANVNAKLARDTVDKYLTRVSESQLLMAPSMQPLRKELLERALAYYQVLVRQKPNDSDSLAELADAYERVARIQFEIGALDDSLHAALGELEVRAMLATLHPSDPLHLHDLASSKSAVARVYGEMGEDRKAFEIYQESVAIRKDLRDEHARFWENLRALAVTYGDLSRMRGPEGLVYRQKGIEILESLVEKRPHKVEYQFELALSYANVRVKEISEAELISNRGKAVAILMSLIGQDPNVMEYQTLLATTYKDLSDSHRKLGQRKEFFEVSKRAIEIHERLASQYPDITSFQNNLAGWYVMLASMHRKLKEMDEYFLYKQKEIEIYENLVERNPHVPTHRTRLMASYLTVASRLGSIGKREEQARAYEKCIRVVDRVPQSDRTIKEWEILGQTLYRMERYAEAKVAFQKNLELRGEKVPSIEFGQRWWYMAIVLAHTGERDTARAHYEHLVEEMNASPEIVVRADKRLRKELASMLEIRESEALMEDEDVSEEDEFAATEEE